MLTRISREELLHYISPLEEVFNYETPQVFIDYIQREYGNLDQNQFKKIISYILKKFKKSNICPHPLPYHFEQAYYKTVTPKEFREHKDIVKTSCPVNLVKIEKKVRLSLFECGIFAIDNELKKGFLIKDGKIIYYKYLWQDFLAKATNEEKMLFKRYKSYINQKSSETEKYIRECVVAVYSGTEMPKEIKIEGVESYADTEIYDAFTR